MFQVRTNFQPVPTEVGGQQCSNLDWSQTVDFDRFDFAVGAAWKAYRQLQQVAEEDTTVTVNVIDTSTNVVVWERTATRWPISLDQASQNAIEPNQTHRADHRAKWHGPQANDWIGLGFLTAFTVAFGLEKRSGSTGRHLKSGNSSRGQIDR